MCKTCTRVNSRFGDDRRDLQHRRQEELVLADEDRSVRRAIHVQYPEEDAEDHGEHGQQRRGHFSSLVNLQRQKNPTFFSL